MEVGLGLRVFRIRGLSDPGNGWEFDNARVWDAGLRGVLLSAEAASATSYASSRGPEQECHRNMRDGITKVPELCSSAQECEVKKASRWRLDGFYLGTR